MESYPEGRAERSPFLNPRPTSFDLFEQPIMVLSAGVGDARGKESVDSGNQVFEPPR